MARGTVPYWPAMMRRALAASYCDMTSAEFEREVVAQRLPMPVKLTCGERWHRHSLDEALERLAGAAVPDWRAECRFYAKG